MASPRFCASQVCEIVMGEDGDHDFMFPGSDDDLEMGETDTESEGSESDNDDSDAEQREHGSGCYGHGYRQESEGNGTGHGASGSSSCRADSLSPERGRGLGVGCGSPDGGSGTEHEDSPGSVNDGWHGDSPESGCGSGRGGNPGSVSGRGVSHGHGVSRGSGCGGSVSGRGGSRGSGSGSVCGGSVSGRGVSHGSVSRGSGRGGSRVSGRGGSRGVSSRGHSVRRRGSGSGVSRRGCGSGRSRGRVCTSDVEERQRSDRGSDVDVQPFIKHVGPTFPLTEDPTELFLALFTPQLLNHIVTETNRFAALCLSTSHEGEGPPPDSESDDAEDYVGLTSVTSERARSIISRKRRSLARRVCRLKANKHLAARNFLSHKSSKQVRTVVDLFPDIGQAIESFVSESNVGADAWRRTGVLTFDGNLRVKQKVTYERIQQHLEDKYKHKFSYGTIVQLCVARNKRRRSSMNYKGVAQVTTRRARKGFQLRYKPDKHWSAALYRGLNLIQYEDGSDITNINRDDASGFRLDTLTTHCKHGTPAVSGRDVLTTHTDYVNRYPSVLQTTSYNFTATKTTKEMCAGVVKGAKVYLKNPTQHHADLEMLINISELQSCLTNPLSGCPKKIECVRVDGATDEGPAHDEVRFWWAVRHLEHGKLETLVSSRSSGSSYLNRVELQNGCLALGHANLFIPSTLSGSNFSPDTRAVDMDRVKKNLELATSVYIDRVNNSPCGATVILLYKGADSISLQKKREHLMVR